MTDDSFQPLDWSMVLPELESVQDAESTGYTFDGVEGWAIRQGWFGGGLSDGVELIELCNGPLSVWILPTRGMGIWRAEFNGIPVGWNSPVRQPVHPAFVNLASRNGLGWLDGFNELVSRCGLSFNGPPGHDDGAASPIESEITLHGRIANIPAHSVTCSVNSRGDMEVAGLVEESTLFGPDLELASAIHTRPGSNSFTIRDVITNRRSVPAELELLYHINVGEPFLDQGARLVCPAQLVAPRDNRAAGGITSWEEYLGPTPGYAEQAYFFQQQPDSAGMTSVLLKNAAGTLAFGLRYQPLQLPCFTQWKCTQPRRDGYVTGLEPGTNYPNFKAFERRQGRVKTLEPGESFEVELQLTVHEGTDAVRQVEEEISSLLREAPEILAAPSRPFSDVE